ncbi:MAG: hypothetical protein IJA10_14640 [Lachnospiraceae bacterium]|nr:hypothetical protein [Lachnospiraceae bacterium]
MKKQYIIIAFITIILFIASGIYFSQSTWESTAGSNGYYNKDTYLEGGIGRSMYSKDVRIHYDYIIESGGIRYEILDESGNVIYELEVTESGSGYITFDNETPKLYYEREYALTEDTIAYSNISFELRYSNFEMLLKAINRWSNYDLFSDNFPNKRFFVDTDTPFPSFAYESIWYPKESQE